MDSYSYATRAVKEFTNLPSDEDRFLHAVKKTLNEHDMPDDDHLLKAILELHMDDERSQHADITHIHLVTIFQSRNMFFQNINNVKGADMVEVVKTRNRTLERVLGIIVFIHVLIKQETPPQKEPVKEVNIAAETAAAPVPDTPKDGEPLNLDANPDPAPVSVKPDVRIQDTVADDISTVETVLTCVMIGIAIGLFIVFVF